VSSHAFNGHRRVVPAAIALAGLLAGFAWALVEAVAPDDPPGRAVALQLARRLALTDLVLVTEARYLRHLALADRHSAFQDHPLAFEHFPSGAAIGVPAHLRRLDAPPSADANLVAPPDPAR
jgi:hypothetical protein